MKHFFLLFACTFSINCWGQITKLCDLQSIPEISGIVYVNGNYWGLNDGGNKACIYRFDTSTGIILDSTTFANASNIDWEELTVNQNQVFIGDFGNNYGTRKNLRIFRFPISDLGKQNVVVDTINFYYPEQSTFNTNIFTNFDCEAMVAVTDTIYLFSKSYGDAVCRVYALPNQKGNYAAQKMDSISFDFLVTGASLYQNKLAIIGYAYNGNLLPKYFTGIFMNGYINQSNFTTINLSYTGPNQVESILISGSNFLFSAEASNGYSAAFFTEKMLTNTRHNPLQNFFISPNPFNKEINVVITKKIGNMALKITDSAGKLWYSGDLGLGSNIVNLEKLPDGIYFYNIHTTGNGKVIGILHKIN